MKVLQLFANTAWKFESQNARLEIKHPVLFNFAIKFFFNPSSQKVCFVVYMNQVSISYFTAFQVLLLILCSLLGNARDVTENQIDGAVPIN